MSDQPRGPGYVGGEKSDSGFIGRFSDDYGHTITITLANDLIDFWGITDPEEALKNIGPVFIICRSNRGIVGTEYVLDINNLGKMGTYDSTLSELIEIANTPSY